MIYKIWELDRMIAERDNVIKIFILGLILLGLIGIIILGICYFNAPPQGAPYCGPTIKDVKVDPIYGIDNISLRVYGNISYSKKDIGRYYPEPLPVKVIIEVETNEFLEVDREIVSSKNFTLQMRFNETHYFDEKLPIPKKGTYIVKMDIFALIPNKWWGSSWRLTDSLHRYNVVIP